MEIQKIFKHKFVSDPNMDRIFTDFCCLNSIKPDKKNRKFIFYDDLKNITPEEIQVQDILEITENKIITATQKEQQILSRIGQGEFRNQLISYWKGCALSGCSQIELLIASHIRPWAVSSNEERLDVFNGLLLLPNYDKLFDRGFISFDHDGSILISEQIKLADYHKLGLDYDLKIRLIINHQKYLTFHREQIFCSRL